MNFTDYYKILGIDKSASTDEIKKTYRKLVVKYHPDKNPGNKIAEEKFKEINEAYQVLSDPEKKKKYDELGENWKYGQEQGRKPEDFDWSKWENKSGGHQYTYTSEENLFGSEGRFSDFFENLFGNGSRSMKGEDYQAEIEISLEDSYNGTTRRIEVNNEILGIKIKHGVKDGQTLRLKAKGGQGLSGGQRGDIYITVHVASHPYFRRKGDNLYHDAPVDLYTAILGGKTFVRTLNGTIKIDIPKETENGKTLRLKGLGMPIFGKEKDWGDLYVTVKINLPKNLSQKEIGLFQELSEIKNQKYA